MEACVGGQHGRAYTFDLVLSEVNMPTLSGIDAEKPGLSFATISSN
jgi:hypothetical protein